jgi:hypothetical protein
MASQQAVINMRLSGFKVQIPNREQTYTIFQLCVSVFSQSVVLALVLIWETYLTVENPCCPESR